MALAERIERHAEALERGNRSPLYVELMRAAAASAAADGIVARVFPHGPGAAGSVPALRLLAALHHLVLAGRAPLLAQHYPSAGGTAGPGGAWPVAEATIADHLSEVRERARRTVQTNEPGRSAVLFGALLALADRRRRPIRLLEIGASAGLNLRPHRFRYDAGGLTLGDPASPVCFPGPWEGAPVADLSRAHGRLEIVARAACDPDPVDPMTPEGRLTVLSYVWPDETERLARVAAAIDVARGDPVPVDPAPAGAWLADRLAARQAGVLTVVWQSVVRQYLSEGERHELEEVLVTAGTRAGSDEPLAHVTLEPAGDHLSGFELSCRTWPGNETTVLATSGDHGPPVRWRGGDGR